MTKVFEKSVAPTLMLAVATCAALLSPVYTSPVSAQNAPGVVVTTVVTVCSKSKGCRKVVKKVIKEITKAPKCTGSGSSGTAHSTAPMC